MDIQTDKANRELRSIQHARSKNDHGVIYIIRLLVNSKVLPLRSIGQGLEGCCFTRLTTRGNHFQTQSKKLLKIQQTVINKKDGNRGKSRWCACRQDTAVNVYP